MFIAEVDDGLKSLEKKVLRIAGFHCGFQVFSKLGAFLVFWARLESLQQEYGDTGTDTATLVHGFVGVKLFVQI